ncbi:alkyl hydroperoxide reductase subunit F [Neptunomonas marina]|uniref:Alkyl hydroperoxide reductase subunit F n=1 Tax=Neptunomonas marina TaxID=1815562 RepID=A0A437Q961_9GAMM|nr:alkyl hydroperoxide reductase subunit F [Neptunomonas marina]RVU30969.1 alkyl hydroperoxide reductase subunit F [Neptunomonas marina]
MLDATIREQLSQYLTNLKQPIVLTVYVDDSAKSKELHALANDVAELSDKVSTQTESGAAGRIPRLQVSPAGETSRVAFAGIPMGHEFTSFVLALLQAGGHPSKEDQALLAQIGTLDQRLDFVSYISLSCQNCPAVVQALNLMAALNPNITHTMVDGGLFPQEVEERNILAVPAVYLNDELFGQGRMSLSDILAKLDTTSDSERAESLNAKEPFDVLVVGGGPAGAASAIYAARKGIRTGVLAERFGGQVADTMAIENFISVAATDGPKLVRDLEQHVKEYDVDVNTGVRATHLEPAEQPGGYSTVTLDNGAQLKSKAIILSTGARWREMNVPGEHEYRGKGVAYCPHCDGPLFKGKKVAVIGGGNSGIEAAIDLANIVDHVTVLEFSDVLRADEVLIRKARSLKNIEIIMQAQTTEVVGDGQRVTGLRYTDRQSGDSHDIELAGIFVQIGLVPNTEWLKGAVELSQHGEIIVDERGQTSALGVFGAGDATTVPYKQIIIAMGAGATASLGAFDYLIRSSDND